MTNKIILTNNFKNSSIVKVEDISYMPRNSYEYFPAIPIYISYDDINWELLNHVIKAESKLNLYGIDSAGGVWSPSLSHDGKKFYLVYSVVKSFGGNNLNLDNYVMSATNLSRKWSEPVYLNSNKASSVLIHRDKKCYLISLRLNIETEYEDTRCIVIQEFDKKKSTLVGEETIIAKPVARGDLFSEVCFEEDNGVFKLTIVEYTKNKKRSTVLTSFELVSMYHVLKFVDDVEDEPVSVDIIEDIEDASEVVQEIIEVIANPQLEEDKPAPNINFTDGKESFVYTLRENASDDWYKKTNTDDGYKISLRGRNTLSSKFEQSFVGKIVTTSNFTFQTKLNFKPDNIHQSAGISCYYNTDNYFYFRLYKSETFGGLTIGITSSLNGNKFEILHHGIKLGELVENIHMKVVRQNNQLQFSYLLFSRSSWVNVSTPIDITSVEDKHDGNCLVGITACDQNNKSIWADFYGMDLY